MLLSSFVLYTVVSLVLIVLGFVLEYHHLLIAGFSVLFLVSIVLLNSGIYAKSGYTTTYDYVNNTLVKEVTVYDYNNLLTNSDRFVNWLLVLSSGFMVGLSLMDLYKRKEDDYV